MSILHRAVKVASPASRAMRGAAAPALARARTFMSSMDDYGKNMFKGAVADEYLSKQGLPAGLLEDPSWTTTSSKARSSKAQLSQAWWALLVLRSS